ncbi:hypothetical protein LTR95_009041 [Oleoguttula sp. CCFEE 5521]
MCAVTLTVLAECTHELPTIGYCDKAAADVKKYEEKLKGGEKVDPPRTCTESLGWNIYNSLDAPVTCDKCKPWLIEMGKRTFGGAAKATADDIAVAETDGKAANSLQHLLNHAQKKSFMALRR